MDHNKQWKTLKEMGIQDRLTCLLRNLCAGQEAQLEPDMVHRLVQNWERSTSRLYCHPAYLTYMKSISYEMPGWLNQKLESRLLGEISTTSDMQMIPP